MACVPLDQGSSSLKGTGGNLFYHIRGKLARAAKPLREMAFTYTQSVNE